MGLAEILRSTVERSLDAIKEIRDNAVVTVSETVDNAVDSAKTSSAEVTTTVVETVDTVKTFWEMPRDRVLRLMDEAVEATRKAREDAEALTLARAIQAAKDAEEAASKSKGLVEGIVDYIGTFVTVSGKFIADAVKGQVKGVTDAVNQLTDWVTNPDWFLDWLKAIVLAAW